MAARLRIARIDRSKYADLAPDLPPAADTHLRLDAVIRRSLPPLTASLLAAPKESEDGRYVEWYSDLSGQPVPLPSLPDAEASIVRGLLQDRLRSLAELADRLAASGETDLAAALRGALTWPGDETVQVIAGQPVLTFWGYRSRSPLPPFAPATDAPAAERSAPTDEGAPPDAPVSPARAPQWRAPSVSLRSPWVWGPLALGVLALLVWGYYRYTDLPWPPWGPDAKKLLATAGSDEAALRERLSVLTGQLDKAQATCRAEEALTAAQRESADLSQRLAALNEQIEAQVALCPLRNALDAARKQQAALIADLGRLNGDLGKRAKECQAQALEAKRKAEEAKRKAEEEKRAAEAEKQRQAAEKRKAEAEQQAAKQPQETPKPPPEAAAPPAAPKSPPGLPPCPGERPPEEAPGVAVVLDASGSMGLPASMTASQVTEVLRGLGAAGPLGAIIGGLGGLVVQQTSGPSRLDEAKKGINSVLHSLPNDVSVGMVTLQDCPAPTNHGFYSAGQRGVLSQQVNRLRPMRGTPLAGGLREAVGMLDGVNADAIVVVISDGDDTCGGDPCAVARALKAQKPRLKINVVDIAGGESRCMATATGGRVLTPGSGLDFQNKITSAAAEAMAPAHCR